MRTARHDVFVHLTGDQPGIRTREPKSGSPVTRSPHARPGTPAAATQDRVAVQRLRRPRPRRRARLQRRHRVVLRTQRTRRPRLLPPLARRPKPGRHHHHQLARGRARGHPHRRVPLPRRIDRRQTRRPSTRHTLRPLGAHGRSHRRAPARMGRHRKRPRAAVLTGDAATSRRRSP